MMLRVLPALALVAVASLPQSNPPPPASARPAPMVLAAPIAMWDEAIPLGNGMTGGLLWGEGRVLRLSLDRGDLWDLRTPDLYREPDWNYRTIQRLVRERNQGELVRRFDAPFEEIPYPTKLPGARLELTLEDGRALREFALDLERALGRASWDGGDATVCFSAASPVAMIRVRGGRPAIALVAPASLEKLGYEPPRTGDGWLVQEAALGFSYAVHVATREGGGDTEIAVAITSSREGPDPLALARARTAEALARGYAAIEREHAGGWRGFWSRSSIEIPDERAQRHYDLVQYFYGAASRRGAPPMPLQGVWTADAGTLPPWKGDFHFDLNVQLSYWAYLQSGRFDEGAAYLDFMWGLAPAHREFAKRFFGTGGIVVPGVMALDGQPLAGWSQYSLSPVQGAWVAHGFYLHWRYTADRVFLRERAYPYCRLVAEGLLGLLKPGRDGHLALPLSSSPEIHDNTLAAWMTPMTNYDLALLRWLFGALDEMARELGEGAEGARWRSTLARLATLSRQADGGGFMVSPDEQLAESHRHLSHLMAIHPLGLVSVEGPAEDRRTIAASLDQLAALGTRQWVGYSFAWAAAMEARAGRPDPAWQYLDTYLRAFILRNGFHANGDQTRSGLSNFTYRPFTLEGNFAAAQAVHEMLLQSWGGVVRVFPAVPEAWKDAAFTNLRAEGGFIVSATRRGGAATEVSVSATRDGELRLRDPWAAGSDQGRLLRFPMRAGETVVQRPHGHRVLDLSADADRQVVVDREPGQYLGHPTTVLLEDGRTMIAVYPRGHGRGPIVMKRSDDGGRTWSARLPVPASWATSLETPTIHRVADASGINRLILFSGLYPIRMSLSEDDGRTWSELAPIGPFGGIVAMASVMPLRTGAGHYLALFHDDGRYFAEGPAPTSPPTFTVYQSRSTDGGRTWGAPTVIWSGQDLHLCEPGAIRSPDGRRLALLLRENSRRRGSHVVFSDDEGRTWSRPRELPASLTGDRHVARYARDGRLFVSFRDMAAGSPTQGDWVAWVGTWGDIVSGREGQYRVRLMDNTDRWDSTYPGVEVLPDDTIVTTTYGHWTTGEPPYIVSVRLKLSELDKMSRQP